MSSSGKVCPACGSKAAVDNPLVARFECESRDWRDRTPGFLQSVECKLACAERRIVELEADFPERVRQLEAENKILRDADDYRLIEKNDEIAKLHADLAEANETMAEEARHAAQARVENRRLREACEQFKETLMDRETLIKDLHEQVAEQKGLYEEQCRINVGIFEHLQSGKEHWLVIGGHSMDAESVIHSTQGDAADVAHVYGGQVVHVREVVPFLMDANGNDAMAGPAEVCIEDIEKNCQHGFEVGTGPEWAWTLKQEIGDCKPQWPVSPAPLWIPAQEPIRQLNTQEDIVTAILKGEHVAGPRETMDKAAYAIKSVTQPFEFGDAAREIKIPESVKTITYFWSHDDAPDWRFVSINDPIKLRGMNGKFRMAVGRFCNLAMFDRELTDEELKRVEQCGRGSQCPSEVSGLHTWLAMTPFEPPVYSEAPQSVKDTVKHMWNMEPDENGIIKDEVGGAHIDTKKWVDDGSSHIKPEYKAGTCTQCCESECTANPEPKIMRITVPPEAKSISYLHKRYGAPDSEWVFHYGALMDNEKTFSFKEGTIRHLCFFNRPMTDAQTMDLERMCRNDLPQRNADEMPPYPIELVAWDLLVQSNGKPSQRSWKSHNKAKSWETSVALEPKTGGATHFSVGDKGHITLPDMPNVDLGGDFTVACWVTPQRKGPKVVELAEGWTQCDAVQIVPENWFYRPEDSSVRPLGVPKEISAKDITFDSVSVKDLYGNDMLSMDGLWKHCDCLQKELEDRIALRDKMLDESTERWAKQCEDLHKDREKWKSLHKQLVELYDHALSCVSRVFQHNAQPEPPILPDFARAGETLFDAVVRLAKEYKQTDANRAEAWERYGEVCRTNVTLETRLEHAMQLLRDSRTLDGFRAWDAWQDKAIALVAKYAESPLHVPNPQGEQLKEAMELLREVHSYGICSKMPSELWVRLEALLAKHAKEGEA